MRKFLKITDRDGLNLLIRKNTINEFWYKRRDYPALFGNDPFTRFEIFINRESVCQVKDIGDVRLIESEIYGD